MKTLILICIFIQSYSIAAEKEKTNAKTADLAAMSIQDKGIKKLEGLLSKYKKTNIEPDLLARLADLYLERSGITFRVSEGASVQGKSHLYAQSLTKAVGILTELINRYPSHTQDAAAHFKRGKAYKELGMIERSKADYLYLIEKHNDYPQLDSALNDLADYAQDTNKHEEALKYLGMIEKMPKSDYFPIALHKAAWSHFNLSQIQKGLSYLKKEIDFYLAKAEGKGGSQAENAFMESAYMDLSLFYFEALNKKQDFASVEGAVKLFHDYDSTNKYFGAIVHKFARLLKAYTLLPELNQLRTLLVDHDKDVPETSEVVLMQFQYFYEKKDWVSLDGLLKDLKKIRTDTTQDKIEKALSGTLSDLHKLVLKNKASTEIGTLLKPLEHLTRSLDDLLGEKNPTVLMAIYSLAETFFQLGRFKEATREYLRITNPEIESILVGRKLPRSTLYLRLVSSRYQELKAQNLIPERVKQKSFKDSQVKIESDQVKLVKEWIEWVNASVTLKNTPEEVPSVTAFQFEAIKMDYVYFDMKKSVQDLETFGLSHMPQEEGPMALTLVMDTYSLNQEWNSIINLSNQVEKLKKVKPEFLESVRSLDATSKLKVTLVEKNPDSALDLSEQCLKSHGSKAIKTECSIIHAKSLIGLKKLEKADKELTQILADKDLSVDNTKALLLLRAGIRHEQSQTDLFIEDLDRYLTLTHFEDQEMTRQVVEHYWYKGNPRLRALLDNKEVCKGKIETICDQYNTLALIDEGKEVNYKTAFSNSSKAETNTRALWALMALDHSEKRSFQDRLVLLQRLSTNYDSLSPVFQIHLYSLVVKRVSTIVESIRVSAPGIAPLTAEPQTIEKRMKLMQDIDLAFSKLMKMNWMEVKYKTLAELIVIYERLYKDLVDIQTPPELLKPFEGKIADMKKAQGQLQELAFEFSPKAELTKLLLSSDVKSLIPSAQWDSWQDGVKKNKRDFLLHISQSQEKDAPVLKGLVLLMAGAQSEAYSVIESSPDSPAKSTLVALFQRRK